MIVQNVTEDGKRTDVSFTVPKGELDKAVKTLEAAKKAKKLGFAKIISDAKVAKVSVIGIGMQSHSGVAAKMFETLAAKGINILVISTSEIKISVLIESQYMELAVRALHEAYELEKKPERKAQRRIDA
jgi:aspartate kinase